VKAALQFESTDPQVIITETSVPIGTEIKVTNGTHTLTCGLAYLAGYRTVKEGMQDPLLFAHVQGLMTQEILPVLPDYISAEQSREFARNTLERFANPFIQHQWINITLQYTSKMKMRNVPILLNHYKKNASPPWHFTTGFAAYLLFESSKI
jgi:tagaturonate reductase